LALRLLKYNSLHNFLKTILVFSIFVDIVFKIQTRYLKESDMQIDANMNSNIFYHDGFTSISSNSSKTSILVSSGYGKKDIVRSNEVHVEQRENTKTTPEIDVTQLQKDLVKLQDQKMDLTHQILGIQRLKDRDSMQMLHYLNLEQSAIQNNILSIKTQMAEMAQA